MELAQKMAWGGSAPARAPKTDGYGHAAPAIEKRDAGFVGGPCPGARAPMPPGPLENLRRHWGPFLGVLSCAFELRHRWNTQMHPQPQVTPPQRHPHKLPDARIRVRTFLDAKCLIFQGKRKGSGQR